MEFIIPAKYYTFSDFIDPGERETGGDSGKLLLAERKPGVNESYSEKMLIKHHFYNDPCNEFMCSRIAESLGIRTPKVYLISCPNWRKKGFRSRYTCGIEYIDGLRNLTRGEFHSKDGIELIAPAYCLSAMLKQIDGVSLGVAPRGFYCYDFVETFMLRSEHVKYLLGTSIVYRRSVWLELQQFLKIVDRQILNELNLGWNSIVAMESECTVEEKWELFMKPVRNFPEAVTDERIEELTETIWEYYGGGDGEVAFYRVKAADVLAWYYKEYILKCRQVCEGILEGKSKIGDY